MIILFRYLLSLDLIVVSNDIAQLIAELCTCFFLLSIMVSAIICLIRKKNKKEAYIFISKEKSNKKFSYIQIIILYILVLPIMGLTFFFYQSEIQLMEVAFYVYVTILEIFMIIRCVFSSSGIDKAKVFYVKKEFSIISGKEELKKVYIYHKVENDYLLCGDTIEMNKPNQVIEIKEFLKNKFYYVEM